MHNFPFNVHKVSNFRYAHTVIWALLMSIAVVALTAGLGRAALNMKAALTEKPDLAIYVLLPEKELGRTVLLRERENERDYLADSNEGKLFIKLRKSKEGQWYIAEMDTMHVTP